MKTVLADHPAFVVDAIILVLVLEMAGLFVFRLLRHQGLRISELASFLGAGLALLIGVHVVATDGSFARFGAAMLAALGLHLWHVVQRWNR